MSLSTILSQTENEQLSADPDIAPKVACDNALCIDAEHNAEDGGEWAIHVAARAEHGSVELEVYQRPEDGTWKLEVHADFIKIGDGVTLAEAIALADDIAEFARLVERLNSGRIAFPPQVTK